MRLDPIRAAVLSLTVLAAAPAAFADSAASSASSAGSASLGSVSNSIQGSSNSSSKTTQVADGDYRIIDVATVAERPGMLRLHLQPEAAGESFFLELPQAAAPRGFAAGDRVSAKQRPYGIEFAHADNRQAFFLVLADEWFRELDSRPI